MLLGTNTVRSRRFIFVDSALPGRWQRRRATASGDSAMQAVENG